MAEKILIVDDEEIICFSFKTHLLTKGYEILTAEDYDSALEIIMETGLDLIVTDIILGRHTGIDILREIKDRELLCPVIMITGEPNVGTATDAVRLGAFDYLPKPVSKETLLRVVDHALQRKSLLDMNRELEIENEKYRQNLEAIFGSLRDAIITVDNEMQVIEANDAVQAICGFTPEKITGNIFTDKSEGCLKSCHKILQETLKNQKTIKEVPVECRHRKQPGQVVLLTTSLLKDRENEFKGAVLVIRDVTRLTDLERELKDRSRFHNIIGKSDRMQTVYCLLEDLSDTETAVLITGESGTGKEMVAHALHFKGSRADGPLVTVNCSALSENLLESELFGHVRGAFTGAVNDKNGRFQLADNGTIFLDEIGDISPAIQLKLLRVLQEHTFERVGDSETVKVDVRIIAATNCNLKQKVKKGTFREDLYYRLNVIEVSLPPLRERREDITLLTEYFFNCFKKKFNRNIDGISDEVMDIFMRCPWPGNVRELEHAVEHAFVLCHDRIILARHLPDELRKFSGNGKQSVRNDSALVRREEILNALNKTDWNKAKAARLLCVSRPTLYYKISEYNISKSS